MALAGQTPMRLRQWIAVGAMNPSDLFISDTENGYILASGFSALGAEAGKSFNADSGLGPSLAAGKSEHDRLPDGACSG